MQTRKAADAAVEGTADLVAIGVGLGWEEYACVDVGVVREHGSGESGGGGAADGGEVTDKTAEGVGVGEDGGEGGDTADDTLLASHGEGGKGSCGEQRGGVRPAWSTATTAGGCAHVGGSERGTATAAESRHAMRTRSHGRRSSGFLPRSAATDGSMEAQINPPG